MTKEHLKYIFKGLFENTKNFQAKPDSLDNVGNCIERQNEGESKEPAIAIGFNITFNHYLTNGNKRLGMLLYQIYHTTYQSRTKKINGNICIENTINIFRKELIGLEDK